MVKVKYLIVTGLALLMVGCGTQKMSDADYNKFEYDNCTTFFKQLLVTENAYSAADNGQQYWTLKAPYQKELDLANQMLVKFKDAQPPDDKVFENQTVVDMFKSQVDADTYFVHYAETGDSHDYVNGLNAESRMLELYHQTYYSKEVDKQ